MIYGVTFLCLRLMAEHRGLCPPTTKEGSHKRSDNRAICLLEEESVSLYSDAWPESVRLQVCERGRQITSFLLIVVAGMRLRDQRFRSPCKNKGFRRVRRHSERVRRDMGDRQNEDLVYRPITRDTFI